MSVENPRFRSDLPIDVEKALKLADQMMMQDPDQNIHSVGWGEKITGGKRTYRNGIVFGVSKKGLYAEKVFVPPRIMGYVTDVQEKPRAGIELLRLDGLYFPSTDTLHQRCHNTPIPGGVETFPCGYNWLGTLGCKVVFRNLNGTLRHGAITNWHVATGDVGQEMGQPGGNCQWYAKVARSPGVSFSGKNYVDLSVLDIERTDSIYAPKTHTVKAEQVTLGPYPDKISECGMGCLVARDGRTLGRITNGVVTQIGATVQVGYGAGKVATYYEQFIVEKEGGDFSAPGDSGSMVFETATMRPFGLLFAGGGGVTIVSPAEFIVTYGQVTQFA